MRIVLSLSVRTSILWRSLPLDFFLVACIAVGGCGGSSPSPSSPSPPQTVIVNISVLPSGIGLVNGTRFTFSAAVGSGASAGSVLWEFGDGSTSTGTASVTHVYSREGTFAVKATAASITGQPSATTAVRVVSLVGNKWYGVVSGHRLSSSSKRITSFEVEFREPLSASLSAINGLWADNAGCRTPPSFLGHVGDPRSLTFGFESFDCNDGYDFYLRGSADEQGEVFTGTCPQGGAECQFRMTKRLDITGTWSGTWTSSFSGSGAITSTFSQTGDSLTGSVSVTNGQPCFAAGPVSGTLAGNSVTLGVTSSSTVQVTFSGTVGTGGGPMSGEYRAVGSGLCAYDQGGWTLSRQ